MDSLSLYILTFNCGRTLLQPQVFAPYLLSALPSNANSPQLLVICLQEIAPIGYAFLGGSFLSPYYNAIRQAVKLAGKDTNYINVVTRNVGMTAIMVFAGDEIASNIAWLQTGGVGVGVSEMGNKGGVGVRMGYRTSNETMQLTFVAAHLAPMEDALDRRNEDYRNIARRLVFVPEIRGKAVTQDEQEEDAPLLQDPSPKTQEGKGGIYSSASHLFIAGDLNYRTSLLKPSPEDIKTFPQPTNDTSDPRHYSHLLSEDQLSQEVKAGKTLYKLQELPISFPPTYKYHNNPDKLVTLDDEGEWNWATHRWPSWCDRIFFSSSSRAQLSASKYTALPLFSTSDHRPVALAVSVPLRPVSDAHLGEDLLLKTDPDWSTRRVAARRKEVAVGIVAYLGLTREGNVLLFATLLGAIGGWLIIRSMLV